jgi:CheY-like chemotaxis protein
MKKSTRNPSTTSSGESRWKWGAINAPRILVAEDDVEMRRLLVAKLRQAGFETIECADGYQLLDQLGNPVSGQDPDDFDLIVSDIRMPGLTGLEVLEGIHDTDWFVPMILITAFGNEEVHRQARELGAAGMFDKPFEIEDLIDRIREILVLDSKLGDNWALNLPEVDKPADFPIDVIFSDMKSNEFLKETVYDAAEALKPLADDILYCRVVLVGPNHSDGGGRYHIQIMVTTTRRVFVVRSNLKQIGDFQARCYSGCV